MGPSRTVNYTVAVVNANIRKSISKCQGIQNAFNSKKCTVAVVLNQAKFHVNIMGGEV